MANQTELLNVGYEMKLDEDRQNLCEPPSAEEVCSSSLDTTEELYSSSVPDTCGVCDLDATCDETVWLTQENMAELFQKAKSTINEHIKNIYSEGELQQEETMRKFGKSGFSTKPTNYYNLDAIISVGYRVKSQRGVQFRIWATNILKEYLKKGFVLDDERLKGNAGGNYWKEGKEKVGFDHTMLCSPGKN